MIAGPSLSVPTESGWRPATTGGVKTPRSGASPTLPVWRTFPLIRHGGRVQPRRKMVDDDVCALPALESRHLAKGEPRRRWRLLLARRPADRGPGREPADPPGRDRDRSHAGAAGKPRALLSAGRSSVPMVHGCRVSTYSGPAVHVWDLRTIRRQLGAMGLDWDRARVFRSGPGRPLRSAAKAHRDSRFLSLDRSGSRAGRRREMGRGGFAYDQAFSFGK